MKLITLKVSVAASLMFAAPAYAETLAERVERYNIEDQRLTDGNLSGNVLTLYTEDMDGDSRRPVTIDLSDLAGQDGINGINGTDGQDYYFDLSQAGADRALGALQMRTASEGQWVAGTAITGGSDGPSAGAVGIGYGISDDLDFWASGSSAFEGGGWSVAAGATWVLN